MDGIKAAGLQALQAYGGVSGPAATKGPEVGAIGTSATSGNFADMVAKAVDQVEAQGHRAQSESEKVLAGQGNLVDVVTAIAETEVALETMVSVRDKVISAYEEIMRMPI